MDFGAFLLASLLGVGSQMMAANQQQQALNMMTEAGRMSPEEEAAMRKQGMAGINMAYARRGLADSPGFAAGAIPKLESEIALAKAKQRAPYQAQTSQMLMQSAQNMGGGLRSLIPMFMQSGIRAPGGGENDWWLRPQVPAASVTR